MSETIASVAELFIYPVKSMAGLRADDVHVGSDGILGDRQYSFVRTDQASRNSFPWMTARESAQMLLYRPAFEQMPTPEKPEPAVTVRGLDGLTRQVSDSALCQELASQSGGPVFLLRSARGIFDCQHISLFSLASVRALAEEAASPIDPRQFRANIYLEPVSGRAFDEEAWTRYLLQIGDEVLLSVTKRDGRCMMINLDPRTGQQNPKVLKAVAQGHQAQAGVYANVVRAGTIREGDSITLISKL